MPGHEEKMKASEIAMKGGNQHQRFVDGRRNKL